MNNSLPSRNLLVALLFACVTLIPSLQAENFTVQWTASSTGTFFAQIEVPSTPSLDNFHYYLNNMHGGTYTLGITDTWYNCGGMHTVNWGPSLIYSEGGGCGVSIAIYGGSGNYYKYESHNDRGYHYSATGGQLAPGTYWIEIEGYTSDGAQSTATISMNW